MKRPRLLWTLAAVAVLVPLLVRVRIRRPANDWDPALASQISNWLENHREALDLRSFHATLLNTDGKRVILLGEEHGIALTEHLDLAFLRYLHQRAGVRVYMAEFGYASGCLVNRYLDTGDEQVLDLVMRESYKSVAWTKERRDFFVGIRKFNLTLPPGERVRVVGVDVEHQYKLALRYLSELAAADAGRKPSPEIAPVITQLAWTENPASGQAGDLAASLARYPAAYAELLGNRLSDFQQIAGNLQKTVEYQNARGSDRSFAVRERAIYDNFRKLYSRFGGGTWYGRWGAFHIYQRRTEDRDRFASLLNGPDSPVAGAVLSIYPLYSHSEAMGQDYRNRPVDSDAARSRPFATAAMDAPVTLFRLDGADSPFRHLIPGFLQGEGMPADLVQYVVLVRGAAASHPLVQH